MLMTTRRAFNDIEWGYWTTNAGQTLEEIPGATRAADGEASEMRALGANAPPGAHGIRSRLMLRFQLVRSDTPTQIRRSRVIGDTGSWSLALLRCSMVSNVPFVPLQSDGFRNRHGALSAVCGSSTGDERQRPRSTCV